MKIGFVNVSDGMYAYASGNPWAVGGAERSQWLLSRALAAAGWSTGVAVRDGLDDGQRRVIDGVEFIGMGKQHFLMALRQFLNGQRFDWIYSAGATHLLGLIVEIAKRAGARSIFALASDLDVEPRQATLQRRRWWPLYAWGLSRADKIFVQHTGQLSHLLPRWRSKASILPKVCFFDSHRDDAAPTKPHLEREKYVAWVGTLMELKRPDVLIQIACQLPHIQFVVCGGRTTFMTPPAYSERIVDELRTTPNVEYLGQVPPQKAQQVIADAAILLSTSDVEGFPNTFIQAWSSGTPVISLKIDPDHFIERLGLGTVSASFEGAIADINELISSPKRRDEIAYRARKHVMAQHSESAVVAAFEAALYS